MQSLIVTIDSTRMGISIRTSADPIEVMVEVCLMTCPGSDSAFSARAVGLRSGLIVTASAATRRMYAEYLAWRGVSVREVTNATAALDHLSAFIPDVVV